MGAPVKHADAKSRFGVGASVLRKEDARHLAGQGQFVADIRLPRIHDVAFVRSPHAHARIKSIDIPPDHADVVFTAKTLPRLSDLRAVPQVAGFKVSGYPPLATDKVRFVGEVIAVCVARTRAEAEDIAAAIVVQYDVLDAVVDASTADTGPLVHEIWGSNSFIERTFENGDLEAARRAAAVTINRRYRMNRHAGVPLEGRAALAHWDHRRNELVFYNSTQAPHIMRLGLSEVLGLEERQIRVIAPDVGGGFGSKARLSPEDVVTAALALHLGHPVRWIEDRNEHFLASTHTRDHHYMVTAYADARGKILGFDAELHVDSGAYAMWPNGPFLETGMAARNLPGPYDIAAYRVKTHTVATNKPPIGPYRGVGRPGACFAIERTIDEIARAVGRDPVDVRRDNLVRPEQMPFKTVGGLLFDCGDYPRIVELAAETIGLDAWRSRQAAGEKDGRLIGVGFACYSEQTGHGCGEWVSRGSPFIPGYESCTARLMPDGTLELLVGIMSHGQGLETTLSQIAHQELTVDIDKISVRHGDTAISPFGNGTIASRSMVMAGGAVAKTTRLLRDKIMQVGAHLMQADVGTLRCEGGRIVGAAASIGIDEIARVGHLRMEALPNGVEPLMTVTSTYQPGIDTGVFAYAAHVAIVAVDPRTGHVELLDFAVAEDCGTVVNPMIVDAQVRGGVVQGIGTALYEEIPYDEQGQPLATNFGDYLMPGASEMPDIKIAHLHIATPHTEYGVKGMGEGGAIAPPAAIANAVTDALRRFGAEANETPITPRRIVAAITAAKARGRADGPSIATTDNVR